MAQFVDISEQPSDIGRRVLMEANQSSARADLNLGDLRDECVLLDLDQLKQILCGFRNGTKAVRHFRSEALDVLAFFEIV